MNRHALTVATLTALAAPVLAQAPAESPTLCPPGTHAIPEREAVLLNVRPLLVERRWEDLTASLDLLSEAGRFEGSFESQLGLALSRLELPGYDAEIDVWIEAKPESYYPWLVRGMRRVGLAWEARGDGWASSVGEDGWKAFRALLGDARADLERAAELEPGSVWPFVELLSVAMGLSLGDEVAQSYFERGLQADRNELRLYEHRWQGLLPRWGGTLEGLQAFLRPLLAKERVAAEPAFLLLLHKWHEELAHQQRRAPLEQFRRPEVQPELLAAATQLVERYPRSWRAWNFRHLVGKVREESSQDRGRHAFQAAIHGDLKMVMLYIKVARTEHDRLYWSCRGAHMGHADLSYFMVETYGDESFEQMKGGYPFWMRQFAVAGNASARKLTGCFFDQGQAGAPVLPALANLYYRLALRSQQDAMVLHNLGLNLIKGRGCEQDAAEGERLIRQSVAGGNLHAKVTLAAFLHSERGAEFYAEAERLLNEAIEGGHPDARQELELLQAKLR